MRTEINIWTEGFNKELLSPVCLWLENVSSSGGERHVETTDEKKKKKLPHSTPGGVNHQSLKLLVIPWLRLITQAGE